MPALEILSPQLKHLVLGLLRIQVSRALGKNQRMLECTYVSITFTQRLITFTFPHQSIPASTQSGGNYRKRLRREQGVKESTQFLKKDNHRFLTLNSVGATHLHSVGNKTVILSVLVNKVKQVEIGYASDMSSSNVNQGHNALNGTLFLF